MGTETLAPPNAGRHATFWQRFHRMDESKFGVLLLSPTLLILFGFLVIPILYAIAMSTQQVELTISPDWKFVGLQNYTGLLSDNRVLDSIPRTLYFAFLTILISTLLALVLALVLNEPFRGRQLVRVLVLLPWAVAPVVSGVMWRYIFHPRYGLLDAILYSLGFIKQYIVWFDDPTVSLNIASLATAWKGVPFLTLIMLAAMQSIPESLYRAAKMDGANILQRFRYVTLPHLRSTFIFVIVLQTIVSLQVFDLIYTLTRGGPGEGTVVLNFLTYLNAFERLSLGKASAMAILLAVLIIVLSGISLSFTVQRRQKV